MPLKILHFITDLSPDGAQRTLLRLVASLPRDSFHCRVVALMDGGHLIDRFLDLGVPVQQLGVRRSGISPSAVLRLRAVTKQFEPDIIQGWMYHANFAASLAARLSRSGAPVIWNIRRCLHEESTDSLLTRAMVRINAALSSRTAAIVYCAQLSAEQHEKLGFDKTKRVVINNGFDLDHFQPTDRHRAWLRSMIGVERHTPVVGIVGRFHPQKDYPTFLRASVEIANRDPSIHFVCVGRGITEGNPELAQLVSGTSLEGRVHFLGERHDVEKILPSLDLFVSSSSNEGFPNALSEAMACGVPCVATSVGASSELLHGVGPLVSPHDPAALAGAMAAVLSAEPDERLETGRQVRGRIERRYSLRRMVETYADLYRGLMTPRTSEVDQSIAANY